MTLSPAQRVRLSIDNWVAIAGLVLALLGATIGFGITTCVRLAVVETKQEQQAQTLTEVKAELAAIRGQVAPHPLAVR